MSEIDKMIDEIFEDVTEVQIRNGNGDYFGYNRKPLADRFYAKYIGNGKNSTFTIPEPTHSTEIKCERCSTVHIIYQKRIGWDEYYNHSNIYHQSVFEYKRIRFFCPICSLEYSITGGKIMKIESEIEKKEELE